MNRLKEENKKLKLELLKLKNPFTYGKKLCGRNGRCCQYQGCDDCIYTGGIVHKNHSFAGPLCPLDYQRGN